MRVTLRCVLSMWTATWHCRGTCLLLLGLARQRECAERTSSVEAWTSTVAQPGLDAATNDR
eukprot:1808576-Amphidinium_carterae.2